VAIAANQVARVSFEVTCTFNPESRIVFLWRKDASTFDICSVRPDGTDFQELTQGENHGHPTWSPDGTRIAYTSADARIWVMNFDGTEKRIMFDEVSTAPAWSPDGTKIAYTGLVAPNNLIIVRNVDGTNRTILTPSPGQYLWPAWSHDGQRIAFCEDRDVLTVMDADGSDPVALTDGGCSGPPSWSPADQEIVFSSTGPNPEAALQIWGVAADGSELSRLTHHALGCGGPHYLPDGSAIMFHCFQSSDTESVSRIWTMGVDGTDEQLFAPMPWAGAREARWWED
jgi:TolB protein